MTYKRTRSGTIIRLADGACIPPDPGNMDYVRFVADVKADPSCVVSADPPSREETNAPVVAQIAALEATQARPLREAALGVKGALNRLQAIDDAITKLRAKLV